MSLRLTTDLPILLGIRQNDSRTEIPLSQRFVLNFKASLLISEENISIEAGTTSLIILMILSSLAIVLFFFPSLYFDSYFKELDWGIKGWLLGLAAGCVIIFILGAKDYLIIQRKGLTAKISGNKLVLINKSSLKDPWIVVIADADKAKKELEFEMKTAKKHKEVPIHKFFNYSPAIFSFAALALLVLVYLNPLLRVFEISLAIFCIAVSTTLLIRNRLINNLWHP